MKSPAHDQTQPAFSPGSRDTQRGILKHTCSCGGTAGPTGECKECRSKRRSSSNGLGKRSLKGGKKAATGKTTTTYLHRSLSNGHDFGRLDVLDRSSPTRLSDQRTITTGNDDNITATIGASLSRSYLHTLGPEITETQAIASPSHSCVPTGSFTSIPSGTIPAVFGSGKFGASFDMKASFSAPIPCNCSCGEYRQFVRGYFNYNGSDLTHNLCSNTLSRTTWHEDCATIGGTDLKYGYHSIPFATSKFKNPDQATGCDFEGFDFPGFSVASLSSGDTLDLHLEFEGKLVDACDGDKQLQSSSWTVEGTGTVP